jgi:agmatine deiminase
MHNQNKFLMPAEWAPHKATWIAWPHLESDFPGKLEPVRWAFCELIRHLSKVERVEILCATDELEADARSKLKRSGLTSNIYFHQKSYERTWLRDSAPSLVKDSSNSSNIWMKWKFNAWALYDNFGPDAQIPDYISKASQIKTHQATRLDNNSELVLEGGAFDVDGLGNILVTEQCLLSEEQQRNPGMHKKDYEQAFAKYLGADNTIWLDGGCEGDDTHGHIDDLARFIAPGKIVVASAEASDTAQYQGCQNNIERLRAAKDKNGKSFEIIELPFPSPLYCDDQRLPASYLNFYIANNLILVPTFNDQNDRKVLGLLSELAPDRDVIGINCVDWVLGYGSLHCSTQQQPL